MAKSVEVSSGSIGVLGLLGIVFVVLKLTGYIGWSWWFVLMPFYIVPAVCFGLAGLAFGVLMVMNLFSKKPKVRAVGVR